jgi:hypothetical protein
VSSFLSRKYNKQVRSHSCTHCKAHLHKICIFYMFYFSFIYIIL